jgi:hypothetical protein
VVNQAVIRAGTAEFGLVNVPKCLYKFFKEERFARGLVDRGEIRIGTLYEFRRTDGWDELRSDVSEGEFTFSLSSKTPETITADSAPWYLKQIVEKLGMPILSHGGTLNAVATHPDAFIYCTTERDRSEGIESYGTFSVLIHDPESFFRAVTAHLTDDLTVVARQPHGFAAPCLYLEREVHLTSSKDEVLEPPFALIKPRGKSSEREVRAIWHPLRPNPAAFITTIPELTTCCSLV